MGEMKFVALQAVKLKGHPMLNEQWVKDRIVEMPAILGLGDVKVRDKERSQVSGGRLDLLLEDVDPDEDHRYEVEVQLGETDESHIIRTIEYWDDERKHYPQYEHTAVIVAENITGRFLNVINLFNGHIPLIAIQMTALKVSEDQIALFFTKVLDEVKLGTDSDDAEAPPKVRADWERNFPKSLAIADHFLQIIRAFAPNVSLTYTQFYIGLSENGRRSNFLSISGRKGDSQFVSIRLHQSDELEAANKGDLELKYETRDGTYHIRLSMRELAENKALIEMLTRKAYDESKE